VRDDHGAACEIDEGIFQCTQGFNIQIASDETPQTKRFLF
jgi:hypothetical protein